MARFLADASGAEVAEITALAPLRGGAIQENWAVDARFSGGAFAGKQRLVLRTAAPTGVAASLGRLEEFAVLKAAFAAGVTVPEPLWASDDLETMGKPFFTMRRIEGTAAAHRITRDPALEPALPAIAERLGRELARIHTIRPPRADLAFLAPYERVGPAHQIAGFRAYLDAQPSPRPVLEWGIRWLETHIPPPADPILCHHDFRTGNYMLDGTALTGILDWEFSGWGDPHEDIGWFCCKGWRFARLDREAGGIADRAHFYRGYESEFGAISRPAARLFLGGAGECALGDYRAAAKRPLYHWGRAQSRSCADRTACDRERIGDPDATRPRWSGERCVICRPDRRCSPWHGTCC